MRSSLEILVQTNQNQSSNHFNSNLSRNYSVKSNYSHQNKQPKSPKKSNQKNTNIQQSYIAKALSNIQKGCIDQKTGFIKIDGDYGDFKMKIFRNKDKMKYYNDPSSIFTEKDFVQKIWNYADCKVKKNQQEKQTNPTLDEPLSPKKGTKLQKARLGLRRQNSILSPTLKQMENEKPQKNKKLIFQQADIELANKVNQILSKPRDYYLPKPVENEQEEDEKNKLKKGIQQQLRQKQGYLFYRSIPEYMAQKWFKTIDNSTPQGNYVSPYVQQKPLPPKPKKPGYKKTHLFRFLQKGFSFKDSNKNKSMTAY